MTTFDWSPRPPAPDPPTAAPLAVSVVRAAELVAVSPRLLWGELSAGRLRSARVGRRRVVRLADLEAWLAARVEGAR